MTADEVIDGLGGTSAVAKLCGLTNSAVSQWRNNGIPRAWKMVLRSAVAQCVEEQ